MSPATVIRRRGMVEYPRTLEQMRTFTDERGSGSPDEIWFLEHPPVYTLGMNADHSHVLAAGDIPVVETDRGGQVTYHGPGQLVVYTLLDLERNGLGIRALVEALEAATVATLGNYGIAAHGRRDAPGVYVGEAKIASLGLRIRRKCSYHGLAINIAMDLEPFSRINPCGFEGLAVTQIADLGGPDNTLQVANDLLPALLQALGTDSPPHQGPPPALG